ncbi:CLUMA_CG007109, isoform A [Clunio marinus]|uniref:CLUMA_CG007109, isoform A n=1 Tax=Clunio marinus TaxID=568069 RepID=A0A1J1HZP4_9DIPT|nr:CLUMA_CG007109, isoform A [Clunio marinus]
MNELKCKVLSLWFSFHFLMKPSVKSAKEIATQKFDIKGKQSPENHSMMRWEQKLPFCQHCASH